MAIQLSEPFMSMNMQEREAMQDMVLRKVGSDMARVVLAANEYARVKGNENMHLKHALEDANRQIAALKNEINELKAAAEKE